MDSASDEEEEEEEEEECHASLVNNICLLAPEDYRLQNPPIVDFPTHYCEGFDNVLFAGL